MFGYFKCNDDLNEHDILKQRPGFCIKCLKWYPAKELVNIFTALGNCCHMSTYKMELQSQQALEELSFHFVMCADLSNSYLLSVM